MTHGSLFSGIGGFDLAAEWMGWENKFHCEWNEFGQKVLHHYWPKAEQFTDITKTDFTKYANRIDILTGGFPCQPYSSAGKRLGKEDERHLWPEMLRAIREIQPRWVVGENVFGLVNWSGGLVFHEVQADLEAEGYEVQSYVLPAVSINAPHRRDRVWFVAYSTRASERANQLSGIRCQNGEIGREGSQTIYNAFRSDGIEGITSDTKSAYNRGEFGNLAEKDGQEDRGWDDHNKSKSSHIGNEGITSNTNSNGLNQCNSDNEVNTSKGGFNALGDTNKSNVNGDVANTECTRLEHWNETRNLSSEEGKTRRERSESTNEFETNGNGKCNVADSCNEQLQGSKFNGSLRRKGEIKTNGGQFSRSICSKWEVFPTQSPICNGDDGISTGLDGITFSKWRNESIKAGGNAIVPQVVYQIFKTIEQYERISTPDKNK
jgi:DNA (cytosine-5)-methyltransferase 1